MEIPAHLLRDDVTAQELFDYSVEWVQTHPQCRDDSLGICVYRSKDGANACGVGCLLTDAECAPLAARILSVQSLVGVGLLPDRLLPHLSLLSALQALHDDLLPEAEFRHRVTQMAERFALKRPT